jgi:hypothetical protein
LSPAAKSRWTRIQTLLDWRPLDLPPAPPPPAPCCPACQRPLFLLGEITRGPPARAP